MSSASVPGRSAEPSWGEVGRSSRAALILFASHHKTGTALNAALARAMVQARPGTVRLINTGLGDGVKSRGYWWEPAALRSFLEDSPDGVAVGWNEHAYQWPAAEMPAVRCLVHDVRDPVSMVVSAYLYHMRIGRSRPRCGARLCEDWLYSRQPFQRGDFCDFISTNASLGLYGKLALARCDAEALRCQLAGNTLGTIRQMDHMAASVQDHGPRAITLDLLQDWVADFEGTLLRVLRFCGLDDGFANGTLAAYRTAAVASKGVHVNKDLDRAEALANLLRRACTTPAGELDMEWCATGGRFEECGPNVSYHCKGELRSSC